MRDEIYKIAEVYANEFTGIICTEKINEQFDYYAVRRHLIEAIIQAILAYGRKLEN